jgi:CDP-diacylglycerol--serine O-phosphatidyltransferase
MASAFRLARFNLDESQAYGFKGVPTPAAGLVVASLPLIAWYNYFGGAVNGLLFNKWFLYALIALLSYLMISNLPLMALKFKEKGMKANLPKIILVVITIISALLLKWLAVPFVFICYIALSLALKNKTS